MHHTLPLAVHLRWSPAHIARPQIWASVSHEWYSCTSGDMCWNRLSITLRWLTLPIMYLTCIHYVHDVLQIKQETDDFVREREQKTQDLELRQRCDLEQFDLHSLTLGLGAVTDGDTDDDDAVSVRDSSLSLLSTPSPASASSSALRLWLLFLPLLHLATTIVSPVVNLCFAGELCDNDNDMATLFS